MDISEVRLKEIVDKINKVKEEISKGIIGQSAVIDQVMIGILAGGNILLEGLPGLGKTQLVKTISRVMNLSFSRIQFTPDLMPSDVTGTDIIIKDQGGSKFQYKKGPIFANLVLADEINRATPKTQSALLEAMQEGTVTVGRSSYELPQPFMVLATQNPIEMEGTYPLPEAQLDRFLFKTNVEFPNLQELSSIVDITVTNEKVQLENVIDGEGILEIRKVAREIPIASSVKDFALKIILSTHPEGENSPEVAKKYIRYGSSPRGAQSLISTAKVRALMNGRYNVSFDDIKYVSYPVLRHRILLNFEALSEGITTEQIIKEILQYCHTEV
ncbi:AAA family ATPase [Haloimpatiens massiliensis]|uniref:AAA family ATPase n=1 Tax=Haloimpatiens massiliensis TaxID=1658110 RepID=UPI000C82A2B2|nr:MoxR family ATPase [Haloimpatiens massiliensis]